MADINIGQFSEALNDKMDRDSNNANPKLATYSEVSSLSNTVSTLQATVASLQGTVNSLSGDLAKMLGRFDYSNAVDADIKSNSYTCPNKGYIIIRTCRASSGNSTLKINEIALFLITSGDEDAVIGKWFPVSQGDIISSTNMNTLTILFCPQKS